MTEQYKNQVIALVDDDPDIITTVSDFLGKEGFEVKGFTTAQAFFKYLHTQRPNLIILDIVLPDMNGFQICKTLKEAEQFADIPVIILSGQDKDTDQIFGMDLGAIDYLVKPYSLDVLLAKVKAILKRQDEQIEEDKIKVADMLEIDLKRYQVKVDGKKIALTPTEFKILQLLCSRPGQVFSREKILHHLWGNEKVVLDRTIDVHIRHLRRKLGKASDLIEMVRGAGYRLREEF
ncbi:MAG: response regulator [Candidatus Omnitrophica bacterium]|nr:response regulator [Candidatus Omnitrophota bacterium]